MYQYFLVGLKNLIKPQISSEDGLILGQIGKVWSAFSTNFPRLEFELIVISFLLVKSKCANFSVCRGRIGHRG